MFARPFEEEIKNYQKNYRICLNDFQLRKRIEKVKLSACLANCSRARVSFRNRVKCLSQCRNMFDLGLSQDSRGFLFGSHTRSLALIGVFAVDRRSTITDRDARKSFQARKQINNPRHVIVSCTLSIHDITG